MTRTLVAWLSIIALLLCLAIAPVSASFDYALPVLVFCFPMPLAAARVRDPETAPAVPCFRLLAVRSPRAPPLA